MEEFTEQDLVDGVSGYLHSKRVNLKLRNQEEVETEIVYFIKVARNLRIKEEAGIG